MTSVIAGPRTLEQWQDYVGAIGTPWSDEDEALVDSLVTPGPSVDAGLQRSAVSVLRPTCSSDDPRLGAAFGRAAARMTA